MKLLILTQKVDLNDPILGFSHRWIEEFAKHCEQITVIALGVGEYHLPKNVRVFSLGKEQLRKRSDLGNSGLRSVLAEQLRKVRYILSFYHLIWCERKNYDAVFVHMNPVYVIFGGLLWKILQKKIGLWYTHKNVDTKLRIAEKFTDIIFTASRESFRIETSKCNFMGQAVDIDKFRRPTDLVLIDKPFKIVSVGRLTPIKNLDTFIYAAKILKDRGYTIVVEFVGAAVTEGDKEYENKLYKLTAELGLQNEISFIGSIPHSKVAEYYWKNHLSINLCPTGGMDKTILESIASGTPAIVSNEAFRNYFGEHADELIFKIQDEVDCADKIEVYIKNDKKEDLKKFLLKRVEEKSTLRLLVTQIVQLLSEVKK